MKKKKTIRLPMPDRKGQRVVLHPAVSYWQRGDKYGEIIGFGKIREYVDIYSKVITKYKPYRIKLDKSGKIITLHPDSFILINSKRSKNPVKKRRTPAQIAATKKLVAFNKRRRGKKVAKKTRKKRRTAKQIAATRKLVALNKRKGRKKTTRRKNPNWPPGKKSRLFIIFKCKGKSVSFLAMRSGKPGWSLTRGESPRFGSKKIATANARFMAKKRGISGWNVGVTSESTTTPQIIAHCGGKA